MNVERWGWYSVGLNALLAALHAVIAAASGRLAVAAELVHNLVDLAAAVAVLAGIKLASRKSKDFPYGLYKLENLAALGLALLIFLSAYEIARDALLAPAVAVRAEGWMLAVLAATGASKRACALRCSTWSVCCSTPRRRPRRMYAAPCPSLMPQVP
jgi:divalent metal cation (Fe/Co/Zn/Cd) transporter